MPYDESIVARFWAKVPICVHGQDCAECCWEWQGARVRGLYGKLALVQDGKRVWTLTHHIAWELAHHEYISLDLWCLHRCDNPPCCNQQHLFLGTAQDNTDDMCRKGRARGASFLGEAHPRAILTEAEVYEIRQQPMPIAQMARDYGVTESAIRHVLSGRRWRHLLPTQA